MDVHTALNRCRERASAYLDAHVAVIDGAQYWRHSATHEPAKHPAHLLYGTWSGVLASVVLGRDRDFTPDVRRRIARGLNAYQRADGTFMLPEVPESERIGHDDEYLAMHCSNYALGALRALGERPRYPLAFMEPFANSAALATWLARRDWRRPWTEGNNIVNLASFYAIMAGDGDAQAHARLCQIADWLDAQQHPVTGFWQQDDGRDPSALQYAMAGAAHVLHIYYVLGRNVPRAERIVESCLQLGYPGVVSACLDIDMVDILTHLRRYGHRVDAIDNVLERLLVELLQVQNPDGGFGDNYVTPHRLYGHVSPPDASVTWTTWFRLTTIGMIASTLLPEERGRWMFRDTIGSGYFNARYALDGTAGAAEFGRFLRPAQQLVLAAKRNGRFARQRTTSRVRSLLRIR